MASRPIFTFCAPEIVFDGTEGVGSFFHVLRSRTHFRRYRGRRVPFSCFTLRDSFSAVPSASGLVFTFCVPGLIFGGAECVGSRFHILRARPRFRWFRGRRVSFSSFARSDSFSAVTECVGFRFHVLRAHSHFRWYRWRGVPFSCFALPDSFSAIPRASDPFFMFCAPRLVFSGTGGVGSRFQVLRARTHFRRFRGRRVPFSRFALPDSFSAVPSASGNVFTFCVPRFIFGGTDDVRSCFQVLFSLTRFRRYLGRRLPFSCFALPESFSAA
jgi:hypothetical protein